MFLYYKILFKNVSSSISHFILTYPCSGQQTPGANKDLKHIEPLKAFKSAKKNNNYYENYEILRFSKQSFFIFIWKVQISLSNTSHIDLQISETFHFVPIYSKN